MGQYAPLIIVDNSYTGLYPYASRVFSLVSACYGGLGVFSVLPL